MADRYEPLCRNRCLREAYTYEDGCHNCSSNEIAGHLGSFVIALGYHTLVGYRAIAASCWRRRFSRGGRNRSRPLPTVCFASSIYLAGQPTWQRTTLGSPTPAHESPGATSTRVTLREMSLTTVIEHLKHFGKADDVMQFSESSATVALAAERVGTEPARIAKTLAFYDPKDPSRAILVVTAGDARLHNGSCKRTFGGKPRMLAAEDVEPLTGHPIGGVCPFANPAGAGVYLDESLKRFEVVYPAAGSANSAVPTTLAELERLSGALGWVDVTVGWRPDEASE